MSSKAEAPANSERTAMTEPSLIARCTLAEQCLPDAPYRAMLRKLHKDMLDEIDRLKAAQRQWVKLTPEDIKIAIDESGLESHEYGQETIQLIYAIDAKLEEKNTAAQPAPVITREIDA